MAYPEYIRSRAVELRTRNLLSLDEIAQRLALPKTTVYYWIKHVPLGRPRKASSAAQKGNRSMQARYRRLREAAYERGWREYEELVQVPTFRDFVVLYVAEGSKRSRNRVSIGNSDREVVSLSAGWLARLATNPLSYSLQFHADQDLDELRSYWAALLRVRGAAIKVQRKSNSGQLSGRSWRSRFGVLSVTANDTILRARLQAWMDRVHEDWGLNSAFLRGA